MKTVTIFDSKYGSTKRYAEQIADALSCPIFERKQFRPKDFARYDTIIYGGGLYAGRISGLQLLSKNAHRLQDKHIILFTCGLADPNSETNVSNIRNSFAHALPPALLSQSQFFHFRGGIDYSKLTPLHRIMMSGLRNMLLKKSPDSLSEDEREILEIYGKSMDFVRKESLKPLIEYCSSLSES